MLKTVNHKPVGKKRVGELRQKSLCGIIKSKSALPLAERACGLVYGPVYSSSKLVKRGLLFKILVPTLFQAFFTALVGCFLNPPEKLSFMGRGVTDGL